MILSSRTPKHGRPSASRIRITEQMNDSRPERSAVLSVNEPSADRKTFTAIGSWAKTSNASAVDPHNLSIASECSGAVGNPPT